MSEEAANSNDEPQGGGGFFNSKPGSRLGGYEIIQSIGQGSFKYVFSAKACEGDSIVALGIPIDQRSESVSKHEDEFDTLVKLDHPNVVSYFNKGIDNGTTFFVMEYLPDNLRQRIKKGPLEEETAVRIAMGISRALAYAHSHSILHRDVKPDNILLDSEGVPKLADFGSAKIATGDEYATSTMVGSIKYVAPEMFRGCYDVRGDLWSLGVVLYEMLTAVNPFDGPDGVVESESILAAETTIGERIQNGWYQDEPLFLNNISESVQRIVRKLLNKSPNNRYQRAEELTRDLQAIFRNTRMLDDDEGRLEVLIRANVPLIGLLSHEEDRVIDAVRSISSRLPDRNGRPRPCFIWSSSEGLCDQTGRNVGSEQTKSLAYALEHILKSKQDGIYLFLDIHRHYNPMVTRLIRDVAREVRKPLLNYEAHLAKENEISVLFLSPVFRVPVELEGEITLHVFDLPDQAVLRKLLDNVIEDVESHGLPVSLDKDARETIIRSAQGLTRREARMAMQKAVAIDKGLFESADEHVVDTKTQIIRKSGTLQYFHSSESFRDVGGLDVLMHWFEERKSAFKGEGMLSILRPPKGVLLMGFPGCGKSLSARSLAGSWRVPLLRLDIGKVFGAYVGQSEANVRQALQVAEAVSPCVLWLDEVEKGFAGVYGGGGVTARVFSTFLNWLQEKESPVFVIATANNIANLPAEFLRKGRFDEIFFLDLPGRSDRATIFEIHLAKAKRDPASFDLDRLAELTEGFSGAEIEQVVEDGLFTAFNESEHRDLNNDDLVAAATNTLPLSRARAEEFGRLSEWVRENAKVASTPEI